MNIQGRACAPSRGEGKRRAERGSHGCCTGVTDAGARAVRRDGGAGRDAVAGREPYLHRVTVPLPHAAQRALAQHWRCYAACARAHGRPAAEHHEAEPQPRLRVPTGVRRRAPPPHHAVSTPHGRPSYRQGCRVESASQQTPLSGRPRLRALACAHASCEARGASRALWQGSRAAAMRMCANAMRMCANMAMQVRAFDHAADRRGAVLEPVVPGLHSLRQHDSRARGGRPHGPSHIFCVLKQILRATPPSHRRASLRLPPPPSHCIATTAARTVTSHC